MSALILLGFYLSDEMCDELDPDDFAKNMREKAQAGADLELDYAGITDEQREELGDHIRILKAVVIRL
jgi:hypothetical protein